MTVVFVNGKETEADFLSNKKIKIKSKIEFLDDGMISDADWKDLLEEYMINTVAGKITPQQVVRYQKVITDDIEAGVISLSMLKIRNKFIGFGLYQKVDEAKGRIIDLYIREGFRRYGYGTMLGDYMEHKMKHSGITNIELEPRQNKPFWRKRGYVEIKSLSSTEMMSKTL